MPGASIGNFLFGGIGAGIIFKPGATRLLCGKATDSAGTCGRWCDRSRNDAAIPWSEGAEKLCAWRVEDFGVSLRRVNDWMVQNRRPGYDEIIVDAVHWRQHLPEVIECFVNSPDAHAAFLNEFGLSARTHPHIRLSSNWDAPFSE